MKAEFTHEICGGVREDGMTVSRIITIRLNDDFRFEADLPDYVSVAMGFDHGRLVCGSVEALVDRYENACDAYSRYRLAATAAYMLYVLFDGSAASGLRLSFERVLVHTHGDTGEQIVFGINGDGSVGERQHLVGGRYVRDTQEIRAKLASLTNSIDVAASLSNGFHETIDPSAYLLAISTDWRVSTDEPTDTATADLFDPVHHPDWIGGPVTRSEADPSIYQQDITIVTAEGFEQATDRSTRSHKAFDPALMESITSSGQEVLKELKDQLAELDAQIEEQKQVEQANPESPYEEI